MNETCVWQCSGCWLQDFSKDWAEQMIVSVVLVCSEPRALHILHSKQPCGHLVNGAVHSDHRIVHFLNIIYVFMDGDVVSIDNVLRSVLLPCMFPVSSCILFGRPEGYK